MITCWTRNLALIFFGFVAGGMLFEIGLRIVGVSYPSFYTWDEYRVYALRPRAEGWSQTEGKAYIKINSAGLRDREHTKVKPANTLRIAILGDSYAEAMQVSMKDAFWTVLERELGKCPEIDGRQVEVINFGVAGYGTAQELMTFRHRVWDYSPDIVILAVVTGNDVVNNSRTLEAYKMRPFFTYKGGNLVVDTSFRSLPAFRARQSTLASGIYLALNYSRAIQAVNEAKNRIANILTESRNERKESRNKIGDVGEELGLDEMVYSEPKNDVWKEAWRVTEGLILLMRDEVREKEADFLVVTLSNGIQVHPDPSVRQAFTERLGIKNLFYPDLRIKSLGEQEAFSVLNLAKTFQVYAEQHKIFLHGFGSNMGRGHWNAEGHRFAGQAVAKTLCEEMNPKQNMSH
jgi:hypothetical protein